MGQLHAGRLDRKVTLARSGEADHDGWSRQAGGWSAVAHRFASVRPARGREVDEADGRSGLAVMRFWFRHDSVTATIDETWSLVLDGTRYDIIAPPIEIGRREGVEIYATASQLANDSE